MKQARFFVTLFCGLLASCALADEAIHVDLADVVSTGAVESVDGITSSGQPDLITLQIFANSGYAAVIDMRGPDEDRGMDDEKSIVEGLGLDYVAFPVVGKENISFEKAKALDDILAGYDKPVLIHCGSGNRVGAVLALRESLKGASDEEALEYGKRAGMTRLEPLVTERLESD